MSQKLIKVILGVVIVAVALWWGVQRIETANTPPKVQPVVVETGQATQMSIPTTAMSVGSLVALKAATISSELDGRIVKINYKNGDYVRQGSVIIQLDDNSAKANVASAQAALNLSQKTFARYAAAIKEGAITQEDMDEKRADVESKEAALKTAQEALAQTSIKAPFTGVLGAFSVKEGDFIQKAQALVQLVDRDNLQVDYTLPQDQIAKLQHGQPVKVSVNAYPNEIFKGKVTFISPSVDPATRSVAVEATLHNKRGLLSPGLFANVTQVISVDNHATVIPEQALIAGIAGSTVFTIEKGKAKQVKVKVGARVNGYAQILSGITPGEVVVVAGQQNLESGKPVKVTGHITSEEITGLPQPKAHIPSINKQ